MLIADRPVRSGCARGHHRSVKVSEIVADWVSRTLCPAWHCPMGMAQSVNDSVSWFRQGLEWVDEAGKPGQSNRHA